MVISADWSISWIIILTITYMSVLKYGTLHLSVFFQLPSINASRIFFIPRSTKNSLHWSPDKYSTGCNLPLRTRNFIQCCVWCRKTARPHSDQISSSVLVDIRKSWASMEQNKWSNFIIKLYKDQEYEMNQ